LNLVKAKLRKAFLASFGSKNSTNAIVLAGGKTTYKNIHIYILYSVISILLL